VFADGYALAANADPGLVAAASISLLCRLAELRACFVELRLLPMKWASLKGKPPVRHFASHALGLE
jgi:hypothetical protein